MALGDYHPVGNTDSEHAFCALLNRVRTLGSGDGSPSVEARLDLLAAFAGDLRALGPANFLYADGDALFAHGNRRIQPELGRIEPPGLWVLQRHCTPPAPAEDERAGVGVDRGERAIVWIASVPLTNEAWRPLAEGELLAVRAGEVLAARPVAAG
jgi:glutamine amidotransferase